MIFKITIFYYYDFIAIDYFSRIASEKITVVGFSFFKGGYSKYYRKTVEGKDGADEKSVFERMERFKLHNVDNQKAYFEKELRRKIGFLEEGN